MVLNTPLRGFNFFFWDMFACWKNGALINRHAKRRLAIINRLKVLHRLNLGQVWDRKLQKKKNQLADTLVSEEIFFPPNELSDIISFKLAVRRGEVAHNFILIIHFNHSLSIFVPKHLLSLVCTSLVTRSSKPYPASLFTRFWVKLQASMEVDGLKKINSL